MKSLGCVMPTYNQAEFIAEAVASVQGQVDRLVIVDDGSADGSLGGLAGTLRSDACVLRNEENLGTAKAINRGASQLPEQWLTWVSSDNVHTENWASALLSVAAEGVGAVYSAFWYERGGLRPQRHFTPYGPDRLIGTLNCFFGPSFIIRRDVWQKHRGRISHDYDNWLRVEEACWSKGLEIVALDEPLCHYRAHDKRVTITRRHEFDAGRWQAEARERRASA